MWRRFLLLVLCVCLLPIPVRAAEQEKLIALTFDDGPSGRFTRALLDGLAARNAKATFLLCGYRMEQYPDLAQRIWEEGHEIGLHGYSHKPMQKMCRREVLEELQKTASLLPAGCEVSFLRPPGGLCSDCVQAVAEEFGLAILHWSVDPKDWAIQDAAAVANEVIRQAQDGDAILLHDMSDSSVKAALTIVDRLQARGFRFVTASELAQARNIPLTPGARYARFQTAAPK